MDRIENSGSNISSFVSYLFIAAMMFLLSIFLAMIGGCTYRQTDRQGFMKYAVEMVSAATIYIPSF
jgi:hypothetical protein